MCDVTMELVESLRVDNVRLARLAADLSGELKQEVEQLVVQAAQDSFISFLVTGGLALRNPVLCLWFLWIAQDQVKLELNMLNFSELLVIIFLKMTLLLQSEEEDFN